MQGDLKKTWTLINELRGKVKRNIKAFFVINGELVEDKKQIANEFNKFLASTAKQLNAKLCSSTLNNANSCTDDFRCFLNNRINSRIFMSPATVTEIYEIIQNFNNDIASDISIFVLKKCSNVICAKLTRIINSFMGEEYFPEVLKIDKITPIYKKDNPQTLGNYRPVSVLPGLQIRVQHWGGGGMILRFLFLMTFFFARQAFFSPFLLNFNYWGDGGQILGGCNPHPPGICSPVCYLYSVQYLKKLFIVGCIAL